MRETKPFHRPLLGLLAFLFLTGLTVSFYAYVNWQAEKQWEETTAELKARGEKIAWKDFIPPPVADSENFCATPLLASLYNYTRAQNSNEIIYADPDLVKRVMAISPEDSDAEDIPFYGSRESRRLADLKAWQNHYHDSKIFPKPDPSLKASPASSVIAALDLYQKELDELVQASKRPEAQFAIHYEEKPIFSLNVLHIGPTLKLSQILVLRATAFLHAGQSEKAWTDLKVVFKFHQAAQKEPLLISSFVDITCTGIALNPIWEGLALDAWSTSQLQEILRQLEHFDFLEEYHRSMRSEYLAGMVSILDYMKNNRSKALTGLTLLDDGPSEGGFLLFEVIPRGCFDMGKVASIRMLYDRVLPVIDLKKRRYDFTNAALLEAEQRNFKTYSPSDLFLKLLMPATISYARKIVEIQTDVDLARIACELELFRRQNGRYPKDLDELKLSLPQDIMEGKAYSYRQTPDGRYQLWGVGWNQSDDGGRVVFKDSEKRRIDREQGDWVWAYPDKTPVP